MPLFRKRPITVEAFQLPPDGDTPYTSTDWWAAALEGGQALPATACSAGFIIQTLEGSLLAQWGDWVIRGIKGELYPCKPDIFEATYEPVRAHGWVAQSAQSSD